VSDWGADGTISLLEVVEKVHPTILVGTSTKGGAFTEQVIRAMAKGVQRPLVFPLSNPTERIEAVPADVIHWTDGRGLVGTGTPWAHVPYKGTDYYIGQANNALVYPGIGLGTIVARAEHVTDGMLLAASQAIAALVDVSQPGAGLLPQVENLRAVSATVAVAVANQAVADGAAQADLSDPVQAVQDGIWQAAYRPLEVR
jgi:malate dehydrogenase (oxaloacetate-decarboxylating)